MVLIITGILFIIYDISLIIISPGTFLDNITAFTHIWSVLGIYLIFESRFRSKKGKFFFQTWKSGIKKTVVCLLGVSMIVCTVNLFFILTPETTNLEEDAENLILLGGGIDKYGNLPESVQRRVYVAADYMKKHENTICVVTGGTLKWLPYPEAPAIKDKLVEEGIDENRIIVEDQALDTIQNFQYGCLVLADFKGVSEERILNEKLMIITSHFHMRRAQRLAKRMGFKNFSGISTSIPVYKIPHTYLREICAYVKLNLRILLTGKPERIFSGS